MLRTVGLCLWVSVAGSALAAPAAREGGAIALPPILQQEARLKAPVTLRLKRSPLSAILAELGLQAKVTLTAAADVADEPAVVYATDRPAAEVMQHLAALFNYQWTRTGRPPAYGYQLYQDLRSKQEEEALREADRLRAIAGLRAALAQRLEMAHRSPAALNQEADALEGDLASAPQAASARQPAAVFATAALRDRVRRQAQLPRLREMADPLKRVLLNVLASLSSDAWKALIQGAPVVLSTRAAAGAIPLPPALEQQLRAAHPSRNITDVVPQFDSPDEADRYQTSERNRQQDWAKADTYRVVVWAEFQPDSFDALEAVSPTPPTQGVQAALHAVPTTQMPAGFSAPAPDAVGLTISSDEISTANQAARGALIAAAGDGTQGGGDATEAADGSVLRTARVFKVALRPQEGLPVLSAPPLYAILPQIAETYGLNLVADAYRQPRFVLPPVPSTGKQPLAEVLAQYVQPLANWKQEGAFFHVRRPTWYDDRLAEIPERVVQQWADRLANQPALSLEDAATLALTLRDEQLGEFEPSMREKGIRFRNQSFARAVLDNADILRAYGSLSPPQRQSLAAGKALPCEAMPREALRRLSAAFRQLYRLPADPRLRPLFALPGSAVLDVPSSALSLIYVRSPGPVGGGKSYVEAQFRLHTGESGSPPVWYLPLPDIEYVRPVPADRAGVQPSDAPPHPSAPPGH